MKFVLNNNFVWLGNFAYNCVTRVGGLTLKKTMATSSDLSFIQVKNASNPFVLFKEWLEEAKMNGGVSSLMNLATATRNGKVSNRTMVIREIMDDGSLAFTAQRKSNKIHDIGENPQVAATVLLMYCKNNTHITRQIRFKGLAEQLPQNQCQVYFCQEKLPAKIRSWICQECSPIGWDTLKEKHDNLLNQVANKKEIEMPDTQVAYKIIPDEVDFYFSEGDAIADRILFKKDQNSKWTYQRVMP